jgi:hypothetical protein
MSKRGALGHAARALALLLAMSIPPAAHGDPPVADGRSAPAPPGTPRADVCVYAATPAGILAAVAAAREGRSVLVVEPSRWVGGILGAGIKPAQDCANRQAVGGLTVQVFAKAGGAPAPVRDYFKKLLEEHKIPVIFEHRLKAVEKDGRRIARLRLEKAPPDKWGCPVAQAEPGPGLAVEAQVFIDASYEGDLMPKAGVSYAVGREPKARHDETVGGVGRWTNFTPIDPYVKPGDPAGGLLPLVEADHGKAVGEGDDYTQAYNFRFYVTADPQKRVPFTAPQDYDPKQFELVGRYVAYLVEHRNGQGIDGIFPGWKNAGEYNYQRGSLVSISPLGVSRLYQDGDYATRAKVWKMHIDYLRGVHRFLSTDPRVPEATRKKVAELGLDKTHHPDTEGWPNQLYVRVARRLAGRYVLTQVDVMNKTTVDDAIGLGQYGVDTYPARRVAVKDEKTGRMGVATEGNMFIGGNRGTGVPFGVPYRAITPKEGECANLLVPVCFSASFIAYAAARMEPVFMICGESAGVAAAHAVAAKADVQRIDVPKLQSRLRELGQILAWPPAERPK